MLWCIMFSFPRINTREMRVFRPPTPLPAVVPECWDATSQCPRPVFAVPEVSRFSSVVEWREVCFVVVPGNASVPPTRRSFSWSSADPSRRSGAGVPFGFVFPFRERMNMCVRFEHGQETFGQSSHELRCSAACKGGVMRAIHWLLNIIANERGSLRRTGFRICRDVVRQSLFSEPSSQPLPPR